MIDDYSISRINDTASSQNKVNLHMVDTFAAVIRKFFKRCEEKQKGGNVVAKT